MVIGLSQLVPIKTLGDSFPPRVPGALRMANAAGNVWSLSGNSLALAAPLPFSDEGVPFIPTVQERRSDRAGGVCEGRARPGYSETWHGSFGVSSECRVHQSPAGEQVSWSVSHGPGRRSYGIMKSQSTCYL